MAKIGGFSDKNFTEAVKLAQTAQKQAKAANDSADGIQTSLDGKITVGTTAPGNDQAAGHDKGDVWYVQIVTEFIRPNIISMVLVGLLKNGMKIHFLLKI